TLLERPQATGGNNVELRKKRHVRLFIERLEDRRVPAYLKYFPGPFTVQGQSVTARIAGFQLQASIVTTSDRYGVTDANGNGQWQAVRSTPVPYFQQIESPTDQELDVLYAQFGLGM